MLRPHTDPSAARDDAAGHLEAIRQGRRVLLDLSITTSMTYEISLDDGSKTIYEVGGDELIKKPKG